MLNNNYKIPNELLWIKQDVEKTCKYSQDKGVRIINLFRDSKNLPELTLFNFHKYAPLIYNLVSGGYNPLIDRKTKKITEFVECCQRENFVYFEFKKDDFAIYEYDLIEMFMESIGETME